MLPRGFLGQLSDWTAERIYRNKAALEKASGIFGLRKDLDDTEESEKLIGLFLEWLVFDHRQEIFGDRTGLECFTSDNPLNLPDDEMRMYRDLLGFEVGLFEVMEIKTGEGADLLSIASGNKNFVRDINASLFLRLGDTVWARIALVGDDYYMVGSIFIPFPMKIMEWMREAMSEWEKNSFDALAVVPYLQNPQSKSSDRRVLSYRETERNFTKALCRCGMENFFTLETYKEWTTNESKYDLGFAPKALFYLIPDGTSFDDANALIKAATEFANNLPRKFLNGKTPNEAVLDKTSGDKRMYELDIYSEKKYIKDLEMASEHLTKGDFELSYEIFERVIKNLLKDKVPFFGTFRIYANLAVCCFHKGDGGEMLGEELLNAASRINPLYDFAIQCKEKYVNLADDFSGISKKDIKMIDRHRDEMKATGKRQYQRRVFYKYEKFLKDIGVSLEYQAKNATAVYAYNKDGSAGTRELKIGRNDSCHCGSGKKFKKCCGA